MRIPAAGLVLSLLFLGSFCAAAQDGPKGHWRGGVELPDRTLDMEVDLDKPAAAWIGSLSVPAQNATGIPLADIAFTEGKVTFRMAEARMRRPSAARCRKTARPCPATSVRAARLSRLSSPGPASPKSMCRSRVRRWRRSFWARGKELWKRPGKRSISSSRSKIATTARMRL